MNGYDEMLEQIDEGRDYLCEKDGDIEMNQKTIENVLKPFVEDTNNFLQHVGEKPHDPLEDDDVGKFYIMICEDGSYYQVDMDNSYWYEEDDGTVVFRVNDNTMIKSMEE